MGASIQPDTVGAYEVLVQFLHRAPIGLVRISKTVIFENRLVQLWLSSRVK